MTTDQLPATRRAPRYLPPAKNAANRPANEPAKKQRGWHWTGASTVAVLGYLWLLLVIVCVGAMSWTGLVRFGTDVLGLPVPLCYGVPVALDGAAITLAFFALRGVLSGGAAGLPRLLAILVVCASSGFNYWQARSTGQGGAAELFFAGMSVLVYVMFEVVLRHLRREKLAELGAIEPPLARFRMARWLRFPWKTWQAWSAAVELGLTDPREALATRWQRPPPPVVEAEPVPVVQALPDEPHEPAPAPRAPKPARKRLTKEEETRRDREKVRALLLEYGDALTGSQAGEAIGKSRSRGQQLIVSEKTSLAALNGAPNGSTPAAS